MVKPIRQLPARVVALLTGRAGYMFLTAEAEQLAAQPPQRFTHAWAELFVLSLGWSLLAIGIWAGTWNLFGEPMGRLMPAVAITGVFVLWPFRRALAGALETLFPGDATSRSVAASVFVLLMAMALLSLRRDTRYDPHLPSFLAWIRPWEKLYRPLVLMPLWGAWAMFITPQFCRPGQRTEPATAAFARGCGPPVAAAVMGLLLGLTITYFNFVGWEQLSISAAAIVAGTAGGAVFCRLTGGLTRRALLAANILTQLTFLLACLAVCNMRVW